MNTSVKMYKSRIWKWGLDKKLKSDEVLAILRLKIERDAQGKHSHFTIRGQPVDLDNINRYVKRNPLLLARLQAGQVPCIQTSHEVSCFTPPPSPTISLRPPPEVHRVDQVLRLFRDYVEGSLSSFAWSWEYDVSCTGRVSGDRSEELFERVLASFALVNRCMMKGDKISVEGVLNPAFESLKEIVAAESPIFVVRTVCLLWYLERHYKNDLLRLVMAYLGNLVPIMLGQHHVLSRIWQIFGSTQFLNYYELSMCLYSMLVPLIEQRIGPANYLTTLLYGDHVDCLYQGNHSSESLTLATHYRAKVDATGQRHPWLLELAITQTAVLCATKEAQGHIVEAMECLQTLKSYPMSEEQEAMVEIQMGNYAFRLDNIRGAITSYRRATYLAVTASGDERLLTTCLANLETALAREGCNFDAERVREYRLKRIADFATETSEFAKKPYIVHVQPAFPAANTQFAVQDESWLWEEGCAEDFLKDLHLAPIDPNMRWLEMPPVTGCWEESALVVSGVSTQHPSLSPCPLADP